MFQAFFGESLSTASSDSSSFVEEHLLDGGLPIPSRDGGGGKASKGNKSNHRHSYSHLGLCTSSTKAMKSCTNHTKEALVDKWSTDYSSASKHHHHHHREENVKENGNINDNHNHHNDSIDVIDDSIDMINDSIMVNDSMDAFDNDRIDDDIQIGLFAMPVNFKYSWASHARDVLINKGLDKWATEMIKFRSAKPPDLHPRLRPEQQQQQQRNDDGKSGNETIHQTNTLSWSATDASSLPRVHYSDTTLEAFFHANNKTEDDDDENENNENNCNSNTAAEKKKKKKTGVQATSNLPPLPAKTTTNNDNNNNNNDNARSNAKTKYPWRTSEWKAKARRLLLQQQQQQPTPPTPGGVLSFDDTTAAVHQSYHSPDEEGPHNHHNNKDGVEPVAANVFDFCPPFTDTDVCGMAAITGGGAGGNCPGGTDAPEILVQTWVDSTCPLSTNSSGHGDGNCDGGGDEEVSMVEVSTRPSLDKDCNNNNKDTKLTHPKNRDGSKRRHANDTNKKKDDYDDDDDDDDDDTLSVLSDDLSMTRLPLEPEMMPITEPLPSEGMFYRRKRDWDLPQSIKIHWHRQTNIKHFYGIHKWTGQLFYTVGSSVKTVIGTIVCYEIQPLSSVRKSGHGAVLLRSVDSSLYKLSLLAASRTLQAKTLWSEHWENMPLLLICNVYVPPPYRGLGLGLALMDDACRKPGRDIPWILSATPHPVLRDYFSLLGFVPHIFGDSFGARWNDMKRGNLPRIEDLCPHFPSSSLTVSAPEERFDHAEFKDEDDLELHDHIVLAGFAHTKSSSTSGGSRRHRLWASSGKNV